MLSELILSPILLPLIGAGLVLFIMKRSRIAAELLALSFVAINVFIATRIFRQALTYKVPWAGFGLEFSLRSYHFSGFIILAASVFGLLVVCYSLVFLKNFKKSGEFYFYMLISLALVNGAVLADNLLLMLFFWEGLLVTLFGLIYIGNKGAFKTATKAFIIVGISDLCMMAGIALTAKISGTLAISQINLSLSGLAIAAFILLMIGAISKAGSMPFHSWIPDAAGDAPLPFMALMPASLEKLLGIYFLSRITLDMFKLTPESPLSLLLMVIGCLTIILAVMMALVQKEYKRLLSYHAISQVGYMVLGIGTALPIGIVGGLFHMINHAIYKTCLFLTGGSVQKQAGNTELSKLGGLAKNMPVTFACFIIAAASISGVPPFNGFFSKELIYDAALERGMIFYILAAVGSFFTAASFLKLGHAVYLGKSNSENEKIKEAHWTMLLPMVALALLCIVFGVYNWLPLRNFIQPVLAHAEDFSGAPANTKIIIISIVLLITALLNHILNVKLRGSGLKAADYIRHAPVFSSIYDKAEKGQFDPYNIGLKLVNFISGVCWKLDRGIDWLYCGLAAANIRKISLGIKKVHCGNYSVYLAWSVLGAFLLIIFMAFYG